jgi:hypothetical protein
MKLVQREMQEHKHSDYTYADRLFSDLQELKAFAIETQRMTSEEEEE